MNTESNLEAARRLFFTALDAHNHGRFAEAEGIYRQALAHAPDRPSILVNLAATLISQSKFEAAKALCERALQVEPSNQDASTSLAYCTRMIDSASPAHGAMESARLKEVNGEFEQALAVYTSVKDGAGQVEARLGMLRCFSHLGRQTDCLDLLEALVLEGVSEAGEAFCQLVLAGQLHPDLDDDRFDGLLVQAITAPWFRPSDLAPLVLARLSRRPWWTPTLQHARGGQPSAESSSGRPPMQLDVLASDPLLLAALGHVVLPHPDAEAIVVWLRARLLACIKDCPQTGLVSSIDTLLEAMILQQFLCEYVAPPSAIELQALALPDQQANEPATADQARARQALAVAMFRQPTGQQGISSSIERLAPRACRALTRLCGSHDEQVRLGTTIPAATISHDPVSAAVRDQYEAHPYPRWLSTPRPSRHLRAHEYVNARVGRVLATPAMDETLGDVLVAGTGTGQQACELALRVPDARITGIDLSRASLGYTAAKSRELGIDNLHLVHADILHVEQLGQRFGLIESSGVLHHMADPLHGLRCLRSVLAVGGFVRLGLYSRLGRSSVHLARRRVVDRGWRPDNDGIRAFRSHVLALDDQDPLRDIVRFRDFYSLSECRDLAFHAHETDFTIPELRLLLEGAGLAFEGFECDARLRQAFEAEHGRSAWRSLEAWDRFEHAHPGSFEGMYQFWASPLD